MPTDANSGYLPGPFPEWRHDPLTGRWVVVARDRAARPRAFTTASREYASRVECPFCVGQEERTPVPILVYRPPDAPDHSAPWWVRVVPNRYPAVRWWPGEEWHLLPGLFEGAVRFPENPKSKSSALAGGTVDLSLPKNPKSDLRASDLDPYEMDAPQLESGSGIDAADAGETAAEEELVLGAEDLNDAPSDWHRSHPGHGVHEVVVEAPLHVVSTVDVPVSQLFHVLWIYRERMRTLALDPRLRYVQIFKNCGVGAGASLEHTHSQLLALPFTPPAVASEQAFNEQVVRRTGECGYCATLERELQLRDRIVAQNDRFAAICPFASRFPFEVCILPKVHQARYDKIDVADLPDLASILHEVIARLEQVLKAPPYNYVLHTAPFDIEDERHYHWHIELFPRLTSLAGFEFGAGAYINPVSPEQAAEALRAATPNLSHETLQVPWVALGPAVWPSHAPS